MRRDAPQGTQPDAGPPPFEVEVATSISAEQLLRQYGCRATKPRIAVLDALIAHDGPIDAIALTDLAQADEPSIHEATVYRTIGVLSELGIVNHVHAGHGPSLVRLSDNSDLVAVCQDCGAIVDLPGKAIRRLISDMQRATGFILEPGHFALEGVCANCTTS